MMKSFGRPTNYIVALLCTQILVSLLTRQYVLLTITNTNRDELV